MKSEILPMFPEEEAESQLIPDTTLSDKVIRGLNRLYDLTDWRCVILEGNTDREYDELPIACYFKAFALPYLVNIPSELALGRLMLHRKSLQKLCGIHFSNLSDESVRTDEKKGVVYLVRDHSGIFERSIKKLIQS